MHISLDNISFYPQPPPAKPRARIFPVSNWKPYETPLASVTLSRAPSPRPPAPRTTVTWASNARPDVFPQFKAPAREGRDSSFACNEFDIEFERIVMAQNGPVTSEADLNMRDDSKFRSENDTYMPQDQHTSSVSIKIGALL
ncbi:hypothetical protein PoHVEF18_010511 [Penicillium ochrochloron]